MPIEEALQHVDQMFERTFAPGTIPGIAWGVIVGGRLVHAGGLGTRRVGEVGPVDVDSIFRIASMTKSFTAATLLLLRDEGRLRLDDPVGLHVPEVAGLRGPTADSPEITIRHLLTMSAGLTTDDPWGDRQQALPLDRFAAHLRGGASFAWTPGLRFEYSNLGYGILGRVITNVAGAEYREVVRDRLLRPLGMDATTYLPDEVPEDRRAVGYVSRDGGLLPEPADGYGALAAMGGIFTSIRDLSIWVAGFLDAFPPRDDPEDGHPLSRAARREMQQVHRTTLPSIAAGRPDAAPAFANGGYGLGLGVTHDPAVGVIVGHGGGYPGFGSNMRWHPASGIGVIAFGNARYAPVYAPAVEALRLLVAAGVPPARRIAASRALEDARADVERLLDRWDDALAGRLFAMNVDLDEPLARRRAEMERLRERHGPFRRDGAIPETVESPAQATWWLAGRGSRLKLEVLLSPEAPPRVQRLGVTVVPDPPPVLAAAAAAVARSFASLGGAVPRGLRLASAVDRPTLRRSLAAAAARFGPVHVGPVIAGDGEREATFRLAGDRGALDLRLALDPASGRLAALSLTTLPVELPRHAD